MSLAGNAQLPVGVVTRVTPVANPADVVPVTQDRARIVGAVYQDI